MAAGKSGKSPVLSEPLMSDPYHTFSEGFTNAVDKLQVDLEDWNALFDSVNTAEHSGFHAKDKVIQAGIKKAKKNLDAIRQTVRVVEASRSRFPHIDDAELEARRDFVKQCETEIFKIEDQVTGPSAATKRARDDAEVARRRRESARASDTAADPFQKSHQDFVRNQRAQMQDQVHRQDEHLGALEGSVVRLGEMARVVNVELTEQETLMNDLDKDVDEAQGNLDRAMTQLGKLLKTKDNCQIMTIVILVVLVLGLAVWAFS